MTTATQKIFSLVIGGIFIGSLAWAQSPYPSDSLPRIEAGHVTLFVDIAIPSASFRQAVDNPIGGTGVGLGGEILVNPFLYQRHSPVLAGLGFHYLTFGRDKQEGNQTNPPYKTSFNYYGIHGAFRILPTGQRLGLAPFIDLQTGIRVYNSRTKVDKNLLHTVFDDDEAEVVHTTNDAAFSYGLGVGFYYRKAPRTDSFGEVRNNVPFTLRLMYLWGDQGTYVKRGTMQVQNDSVTFETGRASIDMLMIQLGIYLF
jgi:hypothetical protein